MKKLFSYIGITMLVLISFFVTEKTTTVIKETDEIMKKIYEEKEKYETISINAKIEENKIIPGQYGKKIQIKKTYEEMKKIGKYNPKYYVYEQIKPQRSIEDIYDKYIETGNQNKKQVSIILNLAQDTEMNYVREIIKKQNIEVTILKDNKLTKENNDFTQINNKESKQKNEYCYTEIENIKKLKECAKHHKHTIKKYDIKNNLLIETKKTLTNGKIISIEINNNTTKELELTINYIKNKGYKIVKLNELISEKNTN